MILMKLLKALALATTAALSLSACGTDSVKGGSTDTGEDSVEIVASIYPLEYLATEVLGDSAEITSLAQQGSDTHDVELSPKQIASLGTADLVLYLKGFQPAVDDAVAQSGNDNVLEVSEVIDLLASDGHAHEEETDGEHAEDQHADEDHNHAHSDFDPHFWQDPERMSTIADALVEAVAEQHPDVRETSTANLDAFKTEMSQLDEEISTGLAECSVKEFITTHQAFNYLTEDLDLTEISVVGLSSNEEPSPARIAEVQKTAKEHAVTTIFFETLTSPAVAEAIAGDLGLETAVLDPLENVSENSPGDDYPSIMRANVEALRTANDCK